MGWARGRGRANPVNFNRVLDKVERRIKRAIRENRRKPHKPRMSAAVISLAAHRPQPDA